MIRERERGEVRDSRKHHTKATPLIVARKILDACVVGMRVRAHAENHV